MRKKMKAMLALVPVAAMIVYFTGCGSSSSSSTTPTVTTSACSGVSVSGATTSVSPGIITSITYATGASDPLMISGSNSSQTGITPHYSWTGGNVVGLVVQKLENLAVSGATTSYAPVFGVKTTGTAMSSPYVQGTLPAGSGLTAIAADEPTLSLGATYQLLLFGANSVLLGCENFAIN